MRIYKRQLRPELSGQVKIRGRKIETEFYHVSNRISMVTEQIRWESTITSHYCVTRPVCGSYYSIILFLSPEFRLRSQTLHLSDFNKD